MTARTAPQLLSSGVELCRLTVRSPERGCDLALPVSAAVGELLSVVVPEPAAEGPQAGWVLQRLGGPPLDPGATPESLGLHDGEVLYVNPVSSPMPEADFDDMSVGVAQAVAARADRWRPELTGRLLLGAASVVVAAYCAVAVSARPHWLALLALALSVVAATTYSATAVRLSTDRYSGVASGLAACVLGALTGLSARHAAAGLFTLDRKAVLALGLGIAVPALVLCVARLPLALFGTLAGCGLTAVLGTATASGLHWDAARTAALLAVVFFAAGALDLRLVLRATRLWVPQLPRTSQELQQDIEPEPQTEVDRRTGRAVALLTSVFVTAAVLNATACALLAREPGWIGWTLASALCVAVLLRARALTVAWQRAALALSGVAGLAVVAAVRTAGLGPTSRGLLLLGLLLAAAGLAATAYRRPRRRPLPAWGYAADLLETWSAVALVPLLLQLLHVYAHLRTLIG
jgi:type VII secretion integral membrane protein EccD